MLDFSRSSGERRVRELALTDHGAEYLSELDAVMQELLFDVTNDISFDSLKTTTGLLNRLAQRFLRCELRCSSVAGDGIRGRHHCVVSLLIRGNRSATTDAMLATRGAVRGNTS